MEEGGGVRHVLVLHGKRQCGELFEQRMERVCTALRRRYNHAIEFHFPDAPFELPLEEEDDIPMRSWWNNDDDWPKVLQHLNAFVLDQGIHVINCIFGFSQGGALAALLACALPSIQKTQDTPQLASALAALRAVVVAGAPHDHMPATPVTQRGAILQSSSVCTLPSLHFMGSADPVVSPQSSKQLASAFQSASVCNHNKGHVFPSRSQELAVLEGFLNRTLDAEPEEAQEAQADNRKPRPFSPTEEQQDELESLEAIYADDFKLLQRRPPMLSITLHVPEGSHEPQDGNSNSSGGSHIPPALTLTYSEAYPDEAPALHVTHVGPLVGAKDGSEAERILADRCVQHLKTVAQDNLGMCMAMVLVEEAQEWLQGLLADVESGAVNIAALAASSTAGEAGSTGHLSAGKADGASAADCGKSSTSIAAANKRGVETVESRRAAVARMMVGDEEESEEEQASTSQFIRQLHREVAAAYPASIPPEECDPRGGKKHAEAKGQVKGSSGSSGKSSGCDGGGGAGNGDGADAGLWKYTIGLVGKPSAGKSTFFNAVTDPKDEAQAAKVAAYSFTTIDPNVGQGYFTSPCPSASLKGVVSSPAHGVAVDNRRKVPVIIKDVAGLVPGAYKGRGKGNAFLNDLCDADVLIHVVDASGMSDENGVIDAACTRNPGDDIQWVQEEIHRWIFNNVRAKWNKCLRGIDHFVAMFSGYQTRPGVVHTALRRAGFTPQDVEQSMLSWKPRDLHLVVAHFLRIRFPLLLALNKADKTGEDVEKVQEAFPHDVVVAMCAKLEWQLCSLRRAGLAEYETGSTTAKVTTAAVKPSDSGTGSKAKSTTGVAKAEEAVALLRRLTQQCGLKGTGVMAAVDAAVHCLRPPLLVFPVESFDTMRCPSIATTDDASTRASTSPTPINHDRPTPSPAREGRVVHSEGSLAHCLLMRPGTTVGDVYDALKRPPLSALNGDFVRAEYYDVIAGEAKQVKRAAKVTPARCILRIMTTKKRSHVAQPRPR